MNENRNITLSADEENSFVKAIKIGYYKEFYKKGLITAEQLDMLISLQNKNENAA